MIPKLSLPTKLGGIFNYPLIRGFGLPILLIGISVTLLLVIARPTLGKVIALQTERATTQNSLSTLAAKIEQLENFASRSEALDDEFKRFNQAVPSESSVPALLTQLQEIANLSGVTITAMQFGGRDIPAEGAAGGQGWFEVRVRVTLESGFDSLLKLLKTLETASRLIDVESLQYSARTSQEGGSVLGTELTFVSYYTAKPVLLPEMPITFSFTDPSFERNSQVLQRLTPYETSIP